MPPPARDFLRDVSTSAFVRVCAQGRFGVGARRAVAMFAGVGLAAAVAVVLASRSEPGQPVEAGSEQPGTAAGEPEIFHTPPGLLTPDEPAVVEFRLACGFGPCTGSFTVEVEHDGSWRSLPVERGDTQRPGWFRATLPDFTGAVRYRVRYADGAYRSTRSWTAHRATFVDVRVRSSDLLANRARVSSVLSTEWDGGLVGAGRAGTTPVGPAGFDVRPDGSLVLHDPSSGSVVFTATTDGAKGSRPVRGPAAEDGEEVVGIAEAPGGDAPGGAVVLFQDRRGAGLRLLSAGNGRATVGPTLRLPDSIAGQVVATPAGVEVQGYPSERWYTVTVRDGRLGLRSDHEDMPVLNSPTERARVHVSPAETRLCLTGSSPSCYRITSDWATGVFVLAGRLPDRSLLVVQAFYTSVPAEESRFAILRLSTDGLSAPVVSLSFDDTVEMSAFSRFRLHGDRLYVAQPSVRGLEIGTVRLVQEGEQ